MLQIHAVFENGVLRPLGSVPFKEGEIVRVHVEPRPPSRSLIGPGTPEQEDFARRLAAARTVHELIAVMETAPREEEDYDILEALDRNRGLTGDQRRFRPEPKDAPNG